MHAPETLTLTLTLSVSLCLSLSLCPGVVALACAAVWRLCGGCSGCDLAGVEPFGLQLCPSLARDRVLEGFGGFCGAGVRSCGRLSAPRGELGVAERCQHSAGGVASVAHAAAPLLAARDRRHLVALGVVCISRAGRGRPVRAAAPTAGLPHTRVLGVGLGLVCA